jgi:hypothetical protein
MIAPRSCLHERNRSISSGKIDSLDCFVAEILFRQTWLFAGDLRQNEDLREMCRKRRRMNT